MSLLQAIVLGIVQGLTEFLPVSSSAHLIIVPWLLGWPEPGLAFDAALHLGTLLAVVAYFWRDLVGMLLAVPRVVADPRAALRDPEPSWLRRAGEPEQRARLVVLIAIATVPGLLVGFFGQDRIDAWFHGEHRRLAIGVIALLLMALAGLLWAAERSAAQQRGLQHLGWRDAVAIGFAQATALLPGVSRSGATITAGLFHGLCRAEAARFSFLLGTPLIFAAGAKGLLDALRAGMSGHDLALFGVGSATSAVVGFAAIWGLLRFLQRSSTDVFVAYRLLLGLTLLALVLAGFR